nr:immunoglobulin heavy chain junction region [Macaca mulatta]MOV38931.1 immunoglobulin heavy chain junction region [Macaca mulatta]MOV41668.1 immunoglobulin heavy chain junction region [Macaca mulatta]MOV41751.1 immunoglobulin heavy chain junction region [Macaca mulatta]MOV44360.1 immunoglobulin heavy chain junction region [Macaca mulatta]
CARDARGSGLDFW